MPYNNLQLKGLEDRLNEGDYVVEAPRDRP